MAYPNESFTDELHETELNGIKYSCYAFSVKGAKDFERTAKLMFIHNLNEAGEVDVDYLKSAVENAQKKKDAESTFDLLKAVSAYVDEKDFDTFFDWHIQCIESCFKVDDGAAERVNIDANDLKRPFNYALFFWFVGVQLGPFTSLLPDWIISIWNFVKMEAAMVLAARAAQSSQEPPQT